MYQPVESSPTNSPAAQNISPREARRRAQYPRCYFSKDFFARMCVPCKESCGTALLTYEGLAAHCRREHGIKIAVPDSDYEHPVWDVDTGELVQNKTGNSGEIKKEMEVDIVANPSQDLVTSPAVMMDQRGGTFPNASQQQIGSGSTVVNVEDPNEIYQFKLARSQNLTSEWVYTNWTAEDTPKPVQNYLYWFPCVPQKD